MPRPRASIVAAYGERIVAGIDARGDRVATRGWQHESAVLRDELVRRVPDWGVGRIVYTEIANDGMGTGYDVGALGHVAELVPTPITASGGAKTIGDLIELRDYTPHNVDAAIIGRALYEGTIDLRAALVALRGHGAVKRIAAGILMLALLGVPAARAADPFEALANKSGGIGGRALHFAVQDDGSSPQVAVQLASGLIQKHVALILGPTLVGPCRAVTALSS